MPAKRKAQTSPSAGARKRKGKITRIDWHSSDSDEGGKAVAAGREKIGESSNEPKAGSALADVEEKIGESSNKPEAGSALADVEDDEHEDSFGCSKPGESGDDTEDTIAMSVETKLFDKFEGKTIFVDDSVAQPPKRVWFLESVDPDKKANFFTLNCLKVGRSDASKFLDLKNLATPVHNQGDLQTVLDLFEDMSSCIQYDITAKAGDTWHFDKPGYEKLLEKRKRIMKTNPLIASTFLHGDIVRAFRRGMSNSAGKNAMQSIFMLASMIVFGEDAVYYDKIGCYPIGSSHGREYFPVKSSPVEFLGYEEMDAMTIDVEPSESVSNVFSPTASNPRSKTSSTRKKKGVYGDLVLISGVEPNWPHFLFVGEVKKESDSLSDGITQLTKEMLGPMMYQSVVFGLVMNPLGACVASMKQDMDAKQIYFSCEQFIFLEQSNFSFVAFKKMFLHIVNALHYCKKNLKQINHKF